MQAGSRVVRGCAGQPCLRVPSPWAAPASCSPSPRRWPVPSHRADKFMDTPHPRPCTHIPAAAQDGSALLGALRTHPPAARGLGNRGSLCVCVRGLEMRGPLCVCGQFLGPSTSHSTPNSVQLGSPAESQAHKALPQGPASGGGEVIRTPPGTWNLDTASLCPRIEPKPSCLPLFDLAAKGRVSLWTGWEIGPRCPW